MFEKYSERINNHYLQFTHCKIRNPIKKNILGKTKLKYKINFKQKDSIYIHKNDFNKIVTNILNCDVYHPNGSVSNIDCFGINYYTKEKTIQIYNELVKKQTDKILLSFLKENIVKYNGFYILGL